MNRRHQLFAIIGLLMAALALVPSSAQSQGIEEIPAGFVRLVRATDLDELGVGRAFGFSYSPADGAFLFIGDDLSPPSGPSAVGFKVLSTLEEVVDTRHVPLTSAEAASAVFDAQGNRFLLLDSAGDGMTEFGADSLGRPISGQGASHGVGHLGARQPQGLAVDQSLGRLYVLDGVGPVLIRVDLGAESDPGEAPFRRIGLSASGLVDAANLAVDPASGNIHIYDPTDQTLHELTAMGRPVAVRDLSGMGISELQGMLFAPTGDLTDDPAKQSLFLLDGPGGQAGAAVSQDGLAQMTAEDSGTAGSSGQLLELSFELAPAPAAAAFTSTLVQTINTYQYDPPSPDSAGVAYLPDSNNLLISDSEVNEMQIFQGVNLFQSTLSGTLVDTMSTMAYSDEPTGISVNPANRHLFISDDTSRRIYEVNPGGDGQYDTSDDVVTEALHTREVGAGFPDPEGVAYDSWGDRILVADGKNAEILIISPGNNGVFDGVPPSGDDTAVTIDTAVHGVSDPEGVTFNYETGNLYVVGRPPTVIAEMTMAGGLVQIIDISAAAADKPAGLAYGPRSNNPSERSIYIAERGVDNGENPNENDGKVYEMSLSSSGGTYYNLTVGTVGEGSVVLNPPGGTYLENTNVMLTPQPSEGWTFAGWSGDLSGSASPETLTMDGNKAVTATFVAQQFDLVTGVVGNGSVTLDPPGGTYDYGKVVTLTATTADPNYEFSNWSGDLSGSTNPETITMTADRSVTANFSLKQYTLTTATVGSGNVTLNPSGGTYDAGTMVAVTAVPDAGWEFSSWSGDLTGSTNPESVTMTGNKSVTATFVPSSATQYTLTVTTVGSGSVDLSPSGGVYNEGSEVTLTAVPDPGWLFTGWSGDLSGSASPETLTMDGDKNVTATFVIQQFDLTTATVGTGSITLDPPVGPYDYGTVVTLMASAGTPDWEFLGWSGDLTGTANPAAVTMDGNKSITANFAFIQYDLSVTEVGSGIVTLNPPGGSYGAGTDVTVTATASDGWEFNSWDGALTGSSNPATITMDGDKSLTAYFTPLGGAQVIYETTVTAGASNTTSVSTSGPVPAATGDLYLVAVSTKNYVNVTAVSGMNLTWYPLRDQCGGRNQTGVEVWWAQGSPAAGEVTATLAESARSAVIAVSQYSGVESLNPTIGPQVVSANSNGVEGACSGGSDGTYYTVDLTTTAVNSVVYGVAALRNKTNEPGVGFIERIEASEGNGGSMAGLAVEDMTVEFPAEMVVDGTLDKNSDWAVIGVELRPIGSGPALYSLTTQTSGQGSIALNPSPGPYDEGTVVTLTANPDSGWQFDGWSGDLTGTSNPETLTMDANRTVTANFSQIPATQYALTVGTQGSGTVNLSPPGGLYDEGTVVTLTPAPDSGWTFTAWSGDLTGNSDPETLTMDADKTVTATFDVSVQFSPTSYSVDEGVGTATIEVTLSAAAGQEVTVDYATSDGSATAVDDYTAVSDTLTFAPGVTLQSFGVPINDDLDEETSETVNLTLTAPGNAILGTPGDQATLTITDNDSPPPVQHSLTTGTVGDGSINLNPPGGTYDEGIPVQLTAVPDNDYWEFSGWSGDLSGTTNPETLTMDADKSVTATFTLKQFTLVTATVGNGSLTVDPPGGTYDAGTLVTLTATADSGWNFSGWSGDLGGSTNPETLLMDGNKSVTANFSEEGSGGGQVTHEGTVTGGSSDSGSVATDVAVTAATNDLYLAAIATKGHVLVSGVSGMGLSWTEVGVQCAGRNQTGISVWMAQGSPTGDQVVTAALADVPRNAVIAVTRYSGVAAINPVGNVASANTNGTGGACSGGSDSNIYSVDVNTTVPGALVYSAVGLRTAENTPGAAFTELADFTFGATGPAGLAAQEAAIPAPTTVAANGTLSKNIDWAVFALEIKPA